MSDGKIIEVGRPEWSFSGKGTIKPTEQHVRIGQHEGYAIAYQDYILVRNHTDEQGVEWKVATMRIINSPDFAAGDCIELYFPDGTSVVTIDE